MDIQAYLDRIDYHGPRDPTAETLRALHSAHLLAVPFENLSIHLGQPIVLDQDALFDKIVRRRRGGFCYELNGLFAALLRALEFDVTLLSARVARPAGGFGPEFDHLTLRVESPLSVVPGQSRRATDSEQHPEGTRTDKGRQTIWLADVGFGDSFREPLRLDDPGEQLQDGRAYRIDRDGAYLTLLRRGNDQRWEPQHRFTLQPRQHTDFAQMCHYHQTAPESSFTQRRVCTRATSEGRITLSDRLLIVTERGERREQQLADEDAVSATLRERFGITL
jgi:N-hydroxyarylamine O-acetyltransferase